MNAQAAAQLIAPDFNKVSPPPEHHHRIRFARSVLHYLGAAETVENFSLVMELLAQHGINYAGQEFPKIAVRKADNVQKTVNNEREQQEWEDMEPPMPQPASGTLIPEPSPHQEGLDLTGQVPQHPKTMEHPAGRATDAETNAAASQHGPVDDNSPVHDNGGENANDGEVHVEEVTPKEAPPSKEELKEEPASRHSRKRPQ